MADALRDDIESARRQMRTKFGAGREIKRLETHLWEGETVRRMTTGHYGKGTGLVVLTDRRLLFVQDGVMSKTTEDYPLDKIASVQWSSGMALGSMSVFASGNKSEIKNLNKDDGKEMAELIRARISGGPEAISDTSGQTQVPKPAAPEPAAAAASDPIDQLNQLGKLRDAGILTEEEFAAKKAEILSRI